MSCHILSFLAFPPAVSVRPLTPRSGYLTSHKSGWATSFCWRQRIRRHGFHQLPPFLETLEIGKFENWEEPLHGLFFIGKMMIIHWVWGCLGYPVFRQSHWGILRPEDAEMACSYTYCISLSCQGELQVLNQLQVPVYTGNGEVCIMWYIYIYSVKYIYIYI